ncbi:MAG: SGNH/GDSL hydrolase family protein [Anaerolineae bacterium]|nr:SGNH/GDSL hydrolase family protein [Anaerolineae bacterium]
MKTILCYGDSNTWGSIPTPTPNNGGRYDRHTRWAGVLRDTLGEEYWVIEEGLGGRTTVWEDPLSPHRNGLTYLPPCLMTHRPIDLAVLLLGTNDLKHRFGLSAYDIASGAGFLVDIILRSQTGPNDTAPGVLLVCPPPTAAVIPPKFADMFAGGVETSRQLAPHYQKVAQDYGVFFLNAGDVIQSSSVDGIHFEPEAHQALGKAVAEKVRAALS